MTSAIDLRLCMDTHYETVKSFPSTEAEIPLMQVSFRNIIEYGMVLWFSHRAVHISLLKETQRCFLTYLCFRVHGEYPMIGYSQSE